MVNQIEPTFFQGTAVRFQVSKDQCRDRAAIFGPDLDDCPILLALFSNGCDLCWQWSHGADFTARNAPTRGVFLTAMGAHETAISTANQRKSTSLAKRAEASQAEY